MSIIKNLWWFFKEEKKRYLIGILSLSLVAVLNLIPPKIMGSVIDAITTGKLTRPQLLWNLLGFDFVSFSYVWAALYLAYVYFRDFLQIRPSCQIPFI